jgi:DNA end-binding protein Ku
MRASWKGYFRIGDVMMPVKLHTATRTVGPHFIQLHAADHSPVTRVTVCLQDGEELSEDDIVRAAEYEGTYVELSDKELERSTEFERNIVIRQFTDRAAIDPIYYDSPYYLAPDKGGELTYAILRRAFERTDKVAIATFLFYGRERLAVVSLQGEVIMIQVLRFYDEIVPWSDIRTPALPQSSPAQISIASRLMEQYNAPFYARDYRNQQLDATYELIEAKAKGLPLKKRTIIAAETTPENEVTAKMKSMLGEDPKALRLQS